MSRPRALSPGKAAWVVRMYEQGMSTARIAEQLGRSHSVVYRCLTDAGVPRRPAVYPARTPGGHHAEVLRQLLAAPGTTSVAIAERCPYGPRTIRKALWAAKRAGLVEQQTQATTPGGDTWRLTEAGTAAVTEGAT